jgi:hypothetical protein
VQRLFEEFGVGLKKRVPNACIVCSHRVKHTAGARQTRGTLAASFPAVLRRDCG